MNLPSKDLKLVLDVVSDLHSAPVTDFARAAVRAVSRLVDADTTSYNEQDMAEQRPVWYVTEPRVIESHAPVEYRQHMKEHPTFTAHRDGHMGVGSVVAVSDLVSARVFQGLPLYREYYRDRAVQDQLVGLVSSRAGRATSLVFSRSRRGFSARERAVVDLLLPHLRQAARTRDRLRRAVATPLPSAAAVPDNLDWDSLSGRERDVVALVAAGASDQHIARALAISPRTVGKHLENVYRKLGTPGRTTLLAALARRDARQGAVSLAG